MGPIYKDTKTQLSKTSFLGVIAVLLCLVLTAFAEPTIPTDEEFLTAKPMSRAKIDLIWADPIKLEKIAAEVNARGGKAHVEFYDAADNDRREHDYTTEDIQWAKQIEKIIDIAYGAGRQGRFEESIKYYKKALVKAPGGDLFLMSIGVAYIQLGQKDLGVRYLERAAAISPNNGRIRRNLQAAKGY